MFVVVSVSVVLVVLVVLAHYEVFRALSTLLPRLQVRPRFRIVFVILGALIGHVLEIWIFAFGFYFLCGIEEFGTIEGSFENELLDYVYYSAVCYTTLGFGDLIPVGHIRFLTAMTALSGLVMITWTAAYAFLEMQQLWREE